MLNPGWPLLVLFWPFLVGGTVHEAVSAEPQQTALNSVQALDYAILPGGNIVIRLALKHELREPPSVVASHHPTANIVMDFAGTVSEIGKHPVEVNQRGLRSLQVVQAGTRTRLVISLVRPLVYETALKGKELLITLQRPQGAASGDAGRRFADAAPGATKHALREVAFQRGETGEGRIIVELSDTATPIEVRLQGKALIVDFLDSTLPLQLERRLDVGDFGTAVRAIETYRLGNHVRMKIELEGAGEYSAYQLSRQFIVAPQTGER